jgi:hypothetical protein
MEKAIIRLMFLLLCLVSNQISAQTVKSYDETSDKFEFLLTAKLGTAKFKETGNVTLNGFTNGADILISKKISKKISLSTGVGVFEFDGNRVKSGNTTSIKNTYLHLPLNLKSNINLFKDKPESQNVFLTIGLGLYGNTLIKQAIETESGNFSDKNLGWNFGFSSQLGIKFKASDKLNLGIGYESQGDFSKMKKNDTERKIEASNSIYLTIGLVL